MKFLSKNGRTGFVLFGHGFTNQKTDKYIEHLHKDFNQFQETIRIFEELDFAFISMADLMALSQHHFSYDKNWLHLTFDDGYQNIYTLVYPYLKAKKIPFSLFVSTHHIEHQERYYTYQIRCAILNTRQEINLPGFKLVAKNVSRAARIRFCRKVITRFKMMGKTEAIKWMEYIASLLSPAEWEHYNNLYREDEVLTIGQLKELASDASVHIGAHNHHHLVLNQNVAEDDICYEMQMSKIWLKKNLGIKEPAYCYPNGMKTDFSPTSKIICQRLGYELAFTTIKQIVSTETDKYEIPRLEMPSGWGQVILLLAKTK